MNSNENEEKTKIKDLIKEKRVSDRKAGLHKPIRFAEVKPRIDGPIDFLRWEKRQKIRKIFSALGIKKPHV